MKLWNAILLALGIAGFYWSHTSAWEGCIQLLGITFIARGIIGRTSSVVQMCAWCWILGCYVANDLANDYYFDDLAFIVCASCVFAAWSCPAFDPKLVVTPKLELLRFVCFVWSCYSTEMELLKCFEIKSFGVLVYSAFPFVLMTLFCGRKLGPVRRKCLLVPFVVYVAISSCLLDWDVFRVGITDGEQLRGNFDCILIVGGVLACCLASLGLQCTVPVNVGFANAD